MIIFKREAAFEARPSSLNHAALKKCLGTNRDEGGTVLECWNHYTSVSLAGNPPGHARAALKNTQVKWPVHILGVVFLSAYSLHPGLVREKMAAPIKNNILASAQIFTKINQRIIICICRKKEN